ncbi:MAG TPA: hypothetical protein VFM94_01760, partial [Solirubrobacterales bacterium]|nr:hypothetical protein [Solirubrobacterales bacterium]
RLSRGSCSSRSGRAGVFLEEGFPRWLFAGCAVAFAGVVLIGLGKSDSSRSGVGFALLIVAAVAYATAVVIQKSVLARNESGERRRRPDRGRRMLGRMNESSQVLEGSYQR